MDWASLASIVGALGTFLSGAAAFLQLLKSPRRSTVVLTSAFIVSAALTLVGGIVISRQLAQLKSQTRLTTIFKGFAAPILEPFGTNGVPNLGMKDNEEIPERVDQYSVSIVKSGPIEVPQVEREVTPLGMSTPRHSPVLLFSPVIHDPVTCGWAGFRIRSESGWDLHHAKYLILLIEATKDNDTLEIKIQDKDNQANRVPLLVKKGWAYYVFPMSAFAGEAKLDYATELAVTDSCEFTKQHTLAPMGSQCLENSYRIGLVEAR